MDVYTGGRADFSMAGRRRPSMRTTPLAQVTKPRELFLGNTFNVESTVTHIKLLSAPVTDSNFGTADTYFCR